MIHIITQSTNPYYNLALEEYFLKNPFIDDDIIVLWQNVPTVVVGRNQCTIAEINMNYVNHNKINIIRRLSGGGAVYHDLGNLNFTFIVNTTRTSKHNFSYFAQPIVCALKQFGITAKFTGRNDITIDGKKISGNAQYFYKNKMLHHGTLLFNTNLQALVDALTPNTKLFAPKTIKSVPSRVTTIHSHLTKNITINQFKEQLIQTIFQTVHAAYHQYVPSTDDITNIMHLAETRYKKESWIFGQLPTYNFFSDKKFATGTIKTYLFIDNNIITSCKFFGDFFSVEDVSILENKLTGIEYEKLPLTQTLRTIDINKYFHNITLEELLSCMIPNS